MHLIEYGPFWYPWGFHCNCELPLHFCLLPYWYIHSLPMISSHGGISSRSIFWQSFHNTMALGQALNRALLKIMLNQHFRMVTLHSGHMMPKWVHAPDAALHPYCYAFVALLRCPWAPSVGNQCTFISFYLSLYYLINSLLHSSSLSYLVLRNYTDGNFPTPFLSSVHYARTEVSIVHSHLYIFFLIYITCI